jgi:hypothetical protein
MGSRNKHTFLGKFYDMFSPHYLIENIISGHIWWLIQSSRRPLRPVCCPLGVLPVKLVHCRLFCICTSVTFCPTLFLVLKLRLLYFLLLLPHYLWRVNCFIVFKISLVEHYPSRVFWKLFIHCVSTWDPLCCSSFYLFIRPIIPRLCLLSPLASDYSTQATPKINISQYVTISSASPDHNHMLHGPWPSRPLVTTQPISSTNSANSKLTDPIQNVKCRQDLNSWMTP